MSGGDVTEWCATVHDGAPEHIGKVKPGARVKAVFKEHREGLVTDFILQLAE
jgi:uncharacterized OB-fold protein